MPHQNESESDFVHEIMAKWVLYPVAGDIASETAFAWCAR